MIENDSSRNIGNPEFDEENRHLKLLVSEIEDLINNYQQYSPYPEVFLYDVASDPDNAIDLKFKKIQNEQYYNRQVTPWIEKIENPYFGRIDLEIDGEFKTAYIGEKDLHDKKGNIVVYSGHSEVGRFFTQRSLEHSSYNGHDYEAFLRRNLLIENRRLKMINDTFVKGLDIKYNGLTDPYLIEVLKRNRRERRLFSILSSIQENQFDIVNQDLNKSFIVQGCAGSGKTAILFQRLASIEYRNKGYIDSRLRFITPNKSFNDFIGPLAKSLGLDKVQPITIIDYYFDLARRYKIPNFPVKSEEVLDDSEINQTFIKKVYSDATLNQLVFNHGKDYINKTLEKIDLKKLIECLKSLDITLYYEDEECRLEHLESFLRKARSYLESDLMDRIEMVNKKKEYALEKFKTDKSKFNISSPYPSSLDLQKVKSNLIKIINHLENSYFSIEDPAASFKDISEVVSKIELINERITRETKEHRSKINLLQNELEEIESGINDEWANVTHPALKQELADLKEALNNTPRILFVRRQKLTDRINEINGIIEAHPKNSGNNKQRKDEIEKELFELKKIVLPKKIGESTKKKCHKYIDFIEACEFLVREQTIINNSTFLLESYDKIDHILKSEKLSFKELYRSTMIQIVNEIAKESNTNKPVNSVCINRKYHTFNLYLTLSLAQFFMEKPVQKDKFICIDEGQEYSPNEYALIIEANSDDNQYPILNIYGDIHQTSSIKGIYDWNQLSFVTHNLFVLKENYRNSKEIVAYTNKKLGLSDIAIGINENIPVKESDLQDVLKEIESGDVCIIIKSDHKLYQMLEMKGLINKKGIAVLTPIMAKGQEYPKAIVTLSPSAAEILYTRAKNELIVCHE